MKKYLDQLNDEVRNVVIVGLAVLLVIGVFFLITYVRISQPYTVDVPPLSGDNRIQFDEILIGSMLNMPEDSYYVFVYDKKHPLGEIYQDFLMQRQIEERYYTANLNNFFNQPFHDTEGKYNDELRFAGNTVVLIEDGTIKEFLETPEEVVMHFEG